MNKKQEEFLKEFHELCKKYSITCVKSCDGLILFESNGESLEIGEYRDGEYDAILATIEKYSVKEEKE